jgi:ArsR family transcriptional regulator
MKSSRCCAPPKEEASPASPAQADVQFARLAWGLAHPARLRILRILLAKNACICGELVDQLPLAQSTVSQHLKILKDTGLVHGEIDGPKVCYCVNHETLGQLKTLLLGLE